MALSNDHEKRETVYRLGAAERRFAEIIWREEPVSSGKLVELADQELNWRKSTTYTVLHRLCEKGLFENVKSTVTALVSREHYNQVESRDYVRESFGGSLPAFFTAFTSSGSISEEEAEELLEMIRVYRKKSKEGGS